MNAAKLWSAVMNGCMSVTDLTTIANSCGLSNAESNELLAEWEKYDSVVAQRDAADAIIQIANLSTGDAFYYAAETQRIISEVQP